MNAAPRTTSGRAFVTTGVIVLAAFVLFLALVSPALQDQLGLGPAGAPLPTVDEPRRYPVPELGGVVVWDASGVCLERELDDAALARTCPAADPLRPVWALDASPDQRLVVVATAPLAASLVVRFDDGGEVTATAIRPDDDLPVRFALVEVPAGATVAAIDVLDEAGIALAEVTCGHDDGGPSLLGGGCRVPAD